MSQLIDVNGQSINYPETGDTNWGDEATDFAVQTSAAFGKLGLASGTSVDIAQTLDVTGNTTLDANLSVAGTTSLTGNVLISGTLGISNGTPSSPSLTPSGDTNTGLYSIGADKIGFAANGSRVGEFGVGYGGFTGNIIQVATAQSTSRLTNSTTSFSSFLSLSFTPRYSTSDILILFTSGAGGGTSSAVLIYSIFRDTTAIGQSTSGTSINSTGGAFASSSSNYSPISSLVVESANNTTTRSYSFQFRSGSAGQLVAIGGRSSDDAIAGYSLLTVMEIQK